jgi:hypothetical protein
MEWTTALGLPPAWFTGWTADATNITLPLASMAEITQTEAAATVTGDIRKVMYAILENMWVKWNVMALADRPTKMTLTKSSSIEAATGVITTVYTYTFKNTITAQDVSNE